MQTTDLLQLAQQGQPQAIAKLMNRKLQPQGITARVSTKGQTLKILLEGSIVPDKSSLTAFVLKGIQNLQVQTFNKLQIFGKSVEQATPAWTKSYPLKASQTQDILADRSAQTVEPEFREESVAIGGAIGGSKPSNRLEAIAELLNRAIADDQITIRIAEENTLLKIIVETDKFLDGQSFATQLYETLKTTNLSGFETVSIYKQKLTGSHSFEIKSFNLVIPRRKSSRLQESQSENASKVSTNNLKTSSVGKVKNQGTGKPKIRIGRLITVIGLGGLAAFFLIRAARRLFFVIQMSPALGAFSVFFGVVILWRAWVVLNPLLQALLRDD